MRVFVTGASGWIGSAVVPELLGHGHEVVGLARSDASAEALQAAGADVVRGTLDDLDLLRETAASADGVVHLAFKHEQAFSGQFQVAVDADREAVDAFGAVLAGTDKPLVIAAGALGLSRDGRVATEDDGQAGGSDTPLSGAEGRLATAQATVALADRGVRSVVVRLSPTVHGQGDNGFMPRIVQIARDTGVAGYLGDGSNRWPAVHRLDAARLIRLGLEAAPAGSTLHAVAEEGVPLKEVAMVIGRHLDVPVASISPQDAPAHFTFLAAFLGADSPVSSAKTRALLGWEPTHPGLIADLDEGHYFG